MFGYVRYDLPNLYVKDVMLYRSLYCGLCKGIGASCGGAARLGLTYDVAFLSALLHNLTGTDIVVEKQHCAEHLFGKRPMAVPDELTKELGALNTILCYYKLTDDIADGRGKKRLHRLWFRRGVRRAKKRYPALVALVEQYMLEQERTERANADSLDRAADPSACMMRSLSRHFLGERANNFSDELFYAIGKWIYLIDALDDYEKDLRRGEYNPYVQAYHAKDRESLLKEQGEEIGFVFDSLFYSMREGLSGLKFYFNRDLTDNVILRGIPSETQRVFSGGKRTRMAAKT